MPTLTDNIKIHNIPCTITGDNEEELKVDAMYAFAFAEQYGFDISQMSAHQNGYNLIVNTCKTINKTFECTIYTPELSDEGKEFINEYMSKRSGKKRPPRKPVKESKVPF